MSIRIRLTLWYVGLLAVTLVTMGVALYFVLTASLMGEIDRQLQERAAKVGESIRAENDPLLVMLSGRIIIPSVEPLAARNTYVQVVRADGSVAAGSQNLPPGPLSARLLALNAEGHPAFETVTQGESHTRIYSTPIIVDGEVIGAVQVGQSLEDIDGMLRRVFVFLGFGMVGGLLLATGGGILLAWLALHPIEELNRTARRITATRDLSQRLPVPAVKDELQALATTFNEVLEQLEALFTAQNQLGADVSHELRTPLTTIRGNIDLLRRGAVEDPAERDEILSTIEGELGRMSRLVADLLLLAQADSGVRLEMGPLELDTLLLEVYRQAHLMAEGVTVRLGNEDQAVVRGDPDRLKQLLLNLVDNACKYTPKGGEVTLSLYREPRWVRVSVSDTGPGLTPGQMERVFDRFYRVEGTPRRGIGLGLAIAKWIAEAHGGQLTVESEPGRGSTFTLWLPSAPV